MNNDEFSGRWKQLKGAMREHLGRLTDDDLKEIEGSRDRLLGRIQSRYGETREAAERKLKELERRI